MAERLKRNLASAFDPGPDFPHRLWLSRTMAALDLEDRASRGRSRGVRPAWLTPAVAALLAVAIVATLVLVGRGLRSEQTTPGKVGPRSVATSKPIRVDPPTVLDCRTQCPDEAGKLHELPIALTYFSPADLRPFTAPMTEVSTGKPRRTGVIRTRPHRARPGMRRGATRWSI